MSVTGEDTTDSSNSTSTFLSAFIIGLVTVGGLLTVWVIIKNRDKRIFQPRTFLPPPGKRAPELPSTMIGFFRDIILHTPLETVLKMQGPDAYFFMRYIRMSILIFGPYFFLTWAIIMPLTGTGNGAKTGLNQFIFGNLGPSQSLRFIGIFLVLIILTFWTFYLIWTEYDHYHRIRQEWLASDTHATLARSRTVVVVNIPEAYLAEDKIRDMISMTGAEFAIQRIWLARQIGKLEGVWEERDKEIARLENAEGKVLALAAKNNRKGKLPKDQKHNQSGQPADVEAGDLIARYIAAKKRPTHKRGFLGLFGKKNDTLRDAPAYIVEQETKLKSEREGVSSLKLANSAFIRFDSREEAHAFASQIGRSKEIKEFKNVRPGVEVVPEDIIWQNLKMSASMRHIRTVISWGLTIGLIIIWAIPVAFVSFISQINNLANTVKFLHWLLDLPSVVIGIIQGILPPVLLAVLFMLLPIVLRKMIFFEGKVRKSEVELELFTRFWLFQVIHGFLIMTVAGGLVNALQKIDETLPELPTLLATKLPQSSTFFLTWLALYAFTSFGLSVSRVVPFVMNHLAFILSGPTPRKTWAFNDKMIQLAWATTWPPVCLLTVVGIVYSCIQPVITVFGLLTMVLLYIMYKYTLVWVADQGDSLETGGEYMRKALDTVFIALYLQNICMAGLFLLFSGPSGGRTKAGIAGGAFSIILVVLTALLQIYLCHFRHPKRACHFLDASMTKTASRVAINSESRESHTYPPASKEGAETIPEDGAVHGNTSGFQDQAFDHPALWKPAPVVWIADDELGIGRAEAARLTSEQVPASTEFATMDAEGKVHVDRCAPDEPWYGGISKE